MTHPMRTRSRLGTLSLTLALACLAACGGGGGDSPKSPAPPPPTEPPTPTPTPIPTPTPLNVAILAPARAAAGTVFTAELRDAHGNAFASTRWTLNGALLGTEASGDLILYQPGAYTLAVVATGLDGSTSQAQHEVQVVGDPLVASRFHACALKPDKSVACWGANSNGELGDRSTTSRNAPVAVAGLSGAVSLALGHEHSCAVRSDTSVACWGQNQSGQLGDGSTSSRTAPVVVAGLSNADQLAAGEEHTCALKRDHTVVCWGRTDPTRDTVHLQPTAVSGLGNVQQIVAGTSFNCALRSDGSVWCWGANDVGQLGRGSTTTAETTPMAVAGLSHAISLHAGHYHACALTADLSVVCWGAGTNGQLGNGQARDSSSPVAVAGLSDVVALSTGGYNACATLRGGNVSCWGRDVWGESSDTGGATLLPGFVPSFGKAAYVAAGEHFSCALRMEGSAWCKGDNSDGELGRGDNIDSVSAAQVSGAAAWWRP